MKVCLKPEDIPKTPHFAIVEFVTVHIPGDERSRTHPGHGYPASDESYAQYTAYEDEMEWRADIERLTLRAASAFRKPFVAVRVSPAAVRMSVDVKVD